MAFFLVGRSADDTVAPLSTSAFESHSDALAELGRIVAAPEFDHWSDEILLVDLEGATPVLVVAAPSPSDVRQAEPPAETPEPTVFAVQADQAVEPVGPFGVANPTEESAPLPEGEPPQPMWGEPGRTGWASDEPQPVRIEQDQAAGVPVETDSEAVVPPWPVGQVEPPTEPDIEPAGSDVGSLPDATAPSPAPPIWPWDDAGTSGRFVVAPALELEIDTPIRVIDEPIQGRPALDESDYVDLDAESHARQRLDASRPPETHAQNSVEMPHAGDDSVGHPDSTCSDVRRSRAVEDYTCDDCIYLDTCPSKGQRRPKDCTSFQWK